MSGNGNLNNSGEWTGTPGDGDLNNNGEWTGMPIPILPPIFPTPPNPSMPNLQVPYARLKSIWDCPKISKIIVELENGKNSGRMEMWMVPIW
jgi:hypothetical protein